MKRTGANYIAREAMRAVTHLIGGPEIKEKDMNNVVLSEKNEETLKWVLDEYRDYCDDERANNCEHPLRKLKEEDITNLYSKLGMKYKV